MALHALIERSRANAPGSAPDWWEDDPAPPFGAEPDGDLDEAFACLLLLLPLSSLVPSEPAAEHTALRAGAAGPPRTRVPAPEVRALARPRPCAGQRPAGVRAMPPSPRPGQAGWERVRGPISQAISLVPDPNWSDRLVLGDIPQLAAAGSGRPGSASGMSWGPLATASAGGRG